MFNSCGVLLLSFTYWPDSDKEQEKKIHPQFSGCQGLLTVLLFFIFLPCSIPISSVSFKRLHLLYLDCYLSFVVLSFSLSWLTTKTNPESTCVCFRLLFSLWSHSVFQYIYAIFGKRRKMELLFLEIQVVYSSVFFPLKRNVVLCLISLQPQGLTHCRNSIAISFLPS